MTTAMHDGVCVITMENPPVNALGATLRRDVQDAVHQAEQDPAVRAIVLRGGGALFSGGADITEFGKAPVSPALPGVIAAIEACSKPVVAAIHGMALGGGLELALGAHYRVCTASAKLGLPEVKLGLLPGAGGTQRLPRLAGVEAALEMIVSGEPVRGERALALHIVDAVVPEERLTEAAVSFAQGVSGTRRLDAAPVAADEAVFSAFAEANARRLKRMEAPLACIEAVRAATAMPLAAGLEEERKAFLRLMDGAQSQALRHVFFAERQAGKIDDLPRGIATRPVARVGIIGAGTMGGGIAMNFLSAGIAVTIVEMGQEALDRGVETMRRNYAASAAKGRLSQAQMDKAMGLLSPGLDRGALAGCDLVIEAVYEDMAVKTALFAELDKIAKPGAILASNTSYLDIDEIAAVTSRPGDVLGLHFFSPANVMKLLEVVRGAKTAPDVLATAMELARRIGKVAVVSRVCHGFIGNRMLRPRQRNATGLLLEGATPEQVDQVHTAIGMPMGPFQMADLAGVDIGWHRDASRIESVQDALCAAGRWGQKTRAGFYDYDDKRRPAPSAAVAEIVAAERARAGVAKREIGQEEILARTLYTMVNEAAHILDEGIAQRASDIDVVWIAGYGWPRQTGGILYWADHVGLPKIIAGLRRYADRMSEAFTLSPLLLRCAEDGKTLGR